MSNFGTVVWFALMGLAVVNAAVLAWSISRLRVWSRDRAARFPSVTVIRPVRGVDPGLAVNARAALEQRYQGQLETLFVVDSDDAPERAVLESVIAEYPGANARVVVAGPRHRERTGKLHAMVEGLRQASFDAEFVCFADSDTRPTPETLHQLASAVLSDGDVGAAFAPAVCVNPAGFAGDVGYAYLLDALYGPQAAVTMAFKDGLPFIMGQTMMLRREALDAAGGLDGSRGQLVDDMHIGARIAKAGYRNVLTATRLPIVSEGISWSGYLSLGLRWMAFGRTGIPMSFNGPSIVWYVVFYGGLVGSIASLVSGAWIGALLYLVLPVTVVASLEMLRRRQGGAGTPLRLIWAAFATLFVLPFLYARAYLIRSVEWRGRVYRLDGHGRLLATE